MGATTVERKPRPECLARGFVNLERLYETDRARYERMADAGLITWTWGRLLDSVHGDIRAVDRLVVEARNMRTVRMDYACGHCKVSVVPVWVLDTHPGYYRVGVQARCGMCEAVPGAVREDYWHMITRVTVDGHEMAWDTLTLVCGHTVMVERRADRPTLGGVARRCSHLGCGDVLRDIAYVSTVGSVLVAA